LSPTLHQRDLRNGGEDGYDTRAALRAVVALRGDGFFLPGALCLGARWASQVRARLVFNVPLAVQRLSRVRRGLTRREHPLGRVDGCIRLLSLSARPGRCAVSSCLRGWGTILREAGAAGKLQLFRRRRTPWDLEPVHGPQPALHRRAHGVMGTTAPGTDQTEQRMLTCSNVRRRDAASWQRSVAFRSPYLPDRLDGPLGYYPATRRARPAFLDRWQHPQRLRIS
jgi:hypothetical protein